MQGDLQQQMGTLRLAEPSEIPETLDFSQGQEGKGLSLGQAAHVSSDSSSVSDSDEELPADNGVVYRSEDDEDEQVRDPTLSWQK